jgi:hypothetical protein
MGLAPWAGICCWGLATGGAVLTGTRGALGAGLATETGCGARAVPNVGSVGFENSSEMRGITLLPTPKRSRQFLLSVSLVELLSISSFFRCYISSTGATPKIRRPLAKT